MTDGEGLILDGNGTATRETRQVVLLARAVKEAEGIAAIPDDLFLRAGVEQKLERIHQVKLQSGSTMG